MTDGLRVYDGATDTFVPATQEAINDLQFHVQRLGGFVCAARPILGESETKRMLDEARERIRPSADL